MILFISCCLIFCSLFFSFHIWNKIIIEVSVLFFFSETINEYLILQWMLWNRSGVMSLESLVHGLYLDACAFSISLTHSIHFHQTSEVMHNVAIINNMKTQSLCFVILTYHKICWHLCVAHRIPCILRRLLACGIYSTLHPSLAADQRYWAFSVSSGD